MKHATLATLGCLLASVGSVGSLGSAGVLPARQLTGGEVTHQSSWAARVYVDFKNTRAPSEPSGFQYIDHLTVSLQNSDGQSGQTVMHFDHRPELPENPLHRETITAYSLASRASWWFLSTGDSQPNVQQQSTGFVWQAQCQGSLSAILEESPVECRIRPRKSVPNSPLNATTVSESVHFNLGLGLIQRAVWITLESGTEVSISATYQAITY